MASTRRRASQTPNGKERWIADYFDQHKKRHIKTFLTQKAAKAWLVEAQGEERIGGLGLAVGLPLVVLPAVEVRVFELDG